MYHLKTICLYLYTLLIGIKFCSILSVRKQLTLQKELHFLQEVKSQPQQNKKANIQFLTRARPRMRNILHRSLERYLSATESSERIDCSEAIYLFQRNGLIHKRTQPCLPATRFQQSHFL